MATNQRKQWSPSMFSRLCNWWQTPSEQEINYYTRANGYGKKKSDVPASGFTQIPTGIDSTDCTCNTCQLSCKKYLPIKNILPPQLCQPNNTRAQRVCAVKCLLSFCAPQTQCAQPPRQGSGDKNATCIRQGCQNQDRTCFRKDGQNLTCVRKGARGYKRQTAGQDSSSGQAQSIMPICKNGFKDRCFNCRRKIQKCCSIDPPRMA